jgi:hypothetical protein
MSKDDPTIGERMNRGMGLDPAFTLDRPSLVDAIRDDTDSTVKRAQANVDQQRRNEMDVERIAKDIEREKKRKAAEAAKAAAPEPVHQPGMDVPHLHEYTQRKPDEA